MSDSILNTSFDFEAQQSLLEEIVAEDQIASKELETSHEMKRSKKWARLFLVFRSVQVLKLASSATSDHGYSPVDNPVATNEITLTEIQETVIAAAVEISAESLSGKDTEKVLPTVENVSPKYDELLSGETEVPVEAHVVQIPEQSSEGSTSNERQQLFDSLQAQRQHIIDIVKNKNFQGLEALGGVDGVAKALGTNLKHGISCSKKKNRHWKCSLSKTLNQVLNSAITFFQCLFDTFKNPIIFLCCIWGTLYLALAIFVESVDIGRVSMAFVAVIVVLHVIVTSMRKYSKKMKSTKSLINIGDIVALGPGNLVPADGIFVPGDHSFLELDGDLLVEPTIINKKNPFLWYGQRVLKGDCRMIVTAVGTETVLGSKMMLGVITSPSEDSEFESKLQKLVSRIEIARISLFIVAMVVDIVLVKMKKPDFENMYKPDIKGEPSGVKIVVDIIMGIFTRSRWSTRILFSLLNVLMIGIADGMPVVVSFAIIIWNRRTETLCKASVRNYLACLKMASVTTIVTDKVGRLMEEEYEISTLCIGEKFISESSVVAPKVLEHLCDGIGAVSLNPRGSCDSKVDALVLWAEAKLGMRIASMSDQCQIVSPAACHQIQEYCHVLVKKNGTQEQMSYLHCNGPLGMILKHCSRYYDTEGNEKPIDGERKNFFQDAYERMQAEDEAEVVAYACKCINISDEASEVEGRDLIFLGMISMVKEKREEIKTAISKLNERGIRTVFVSTEDTSVLERRGHIYELPGHDSNNLIIRGGPGGEFRVWDEEERMENVDKICIMGNCLPHDKILFIESLQKKGKVVALLGQRTIDAHALRQADIGITFGTWTSEVARESAHINVWGGDFSNMVNLIMNGRSYEDKVRTFMQLELIHDISSSLITIASIMLLGNAPMSSIQLICMKFAVALSGGLILLSAPRTDAQMAHQSQIVTKAILRNIVLQVGYQTVTFMSLQLLGHEIYPISREQLQSMVYNGLFLCQMFNTFPSQLPADINFFRGLLHIGWMFPIGILLSLSCQASSWFFVAPRLSWELWCILICIGLFGWVIDSVGKIISLLVPFGA